MLCFLIWVVNTDVQTLNIHQALLLDLGTCLYLWYIAIKKQNFKTVKLPKSGNSFIPLYEFSDLFTITTQIQIFFSILGNKRMGLKRQGWFSKLHHGHKINYANWNKKITCPTTFLSSFCPEIMLTCCSPWMLRIMSDLHVAFASSTQRRSGGMTGYQHCAVFLFLPFWSNSLPNRELGQAGSCGQLAVFRKRVFWRAWACKTRKSSPWTAEIIVGDIWRLLLCGCDKPLTGLCPLACENCSVV